MVGRDFSGLARTVALMAAAMALALSVAAFAAGIGDEDVPSTSVVPAEVRTALRRSIPHRRRRVRLHLSGIYVPTPGADEADVAVAPASRRHSVREPEIEPAQARLNCSRTHPFTPRPRKAASTSRQMSAGKFVDVTGSTHYYLQVRLKSGQTGYLDPSAVELVKPADKVFVLSHDAGVLDKPNRWAKKLAEVHQGHNVHVVGVSLNYMRIRMKSGLEGFIPMTALE